MSKQKTEKSAGAASRTPLQKGRQPGHETGKKGWKTNRKRLAQEPGNMQAGQHPREGEPWGSTPGEVRGNPGGKRGQAMGGKRGTAKSRKAKGKSKRRQSPAE